MSPRTAASQVRGGVVWGIGATLREASEVDPRYVVGDGFNGPSRFVFALDGDRIREMTITAD